ncbi:hypothetical protein [Cyclobacterium plantarum]|uniref:hypothetical protein n=1 Tax=Cyclobacterium plantarum TaxID=2716263 RepID=UPI003F6F05F5
MSKHNLYSTFFIAMLLTTFQACNDSRDDFDHAGLYDSWEMVDYHEDQQLNQVNSLVLNRDGSYQKSITYRDPETDAIVGYYHFQEGSLTLEGEKIAFEAEPVLFIGYEAAWGIMEEFTEMKINSEAQPLRSTVDYREEGSKLALITACNDVILSMFAPHPVYS